MMANAHYIEVILDPCLTVFCGIAVFHVMRIKGADQKSSKLLFATMLTGMLINGMETLYDLFAGNTSWIGYAMVRISSFLPLALMYVLIAFVTWFIWRRIEIRGGRTDRNLEYICFAICGMGIILAILSCITDAYYTINEQNRFVRGEYYWIHMLITGLETIPLLMQVIYSHRIFRRKEFWSFLLLGSLPLLAFILHKTYGFGSSMYNILASVCILIIYQEFRKEQSESTLVRESLKLSDENIYMIFNSLDRFMTYFEMEKLDRFKVRITIEELLLRMQDYYGADEEFDIFTYISFRRPQIRIEKKGEQFNPLSKEDDAIENWSGSLLTSLGLKPTYSYSGGRNIIKLSLARMEMNPALQMVIAVIVGLAIGYVGANTFSSADQIMILEDVFSKIYELMINLLYCVTGPILFMMVVSAILDAAGITEQGGNSIYIVGRYFTFSTLAGIVSIGLVMNFTPSSLNELTIVKSDADTLLNAVSSIIPKDIFTPFVEANTPQLLMMAIITGFAIAVLGSRAKGLSDIIHQGNMVGMQLAQWIGRLIPYFAIFIAAIMYMNGQMFMLLNIVLILFISAFITMLCMAIAVLVVSIMEKVSPVILARKFWPSFKRAFITGLQDKSYSMAESCCINKFGIERHFASVNLPLGLLLYMPANVIGTLLFTIYAAHLTNVTISPLWMLISVVLAVILFVATPPIPGANFLAYIVMFSMFEIDNNFLTYALIYEVLYGIFALSANQMFVQLELILQAQRMGLLKQDVLRRP